MKWQYLVVEVQVKQPIGIGLPEGVGTKLNEYGAQSWELVKVEPITRKGLIGGSFTHSFVLFFKRPTQQQEG